MEEGKKEGGDGERVTKPDSAIGNNALLSGVSWDNARCHIIANFERGDLKISLEPPSRQDKTIEDTTQGIPRPNFCRQAVDRRHHNRKFWRVDSRTGTGFR
ncbi:uncharacterized protein FOMMEDRAFT_156015 [Fomitiporia mediterranea MF3/22]|uniref:uncharacterized protein n=1 Tax=Fomitiporia mediterranea (strain MF3/22) TaxID=694068 RepID=UPI0004408A6B|nr:uncharacterized protein FOMMEDRAFT_156015 [Fomitiporia mediterranea MF3/22]EJD02685.1 hypothetical protein FOMMEDRAFT_156015 [Fomitiporia mediterranea MF3/22]